ncbi:hypothetical protein LX36DRAFT_743032 [Colletotrichum falcatum]|nr:hypothetical protein LX36DRAFT_743032 [Colletotrichum falcatum]
MLLEQPKYTVAQHYLTNSKLQQIHRRFSHPSVHWLHKVLQRARHKTDILTIKEINKFYHSNKLVLYVIDSVTAFNAIITNAGLNFHAAKFKRAARALSIKVKEIPIKAYNINNTAGLDSLVPTLLVFRVYPRISNNSPPSPSTLQRGEAVKKAMDKVRQLHAKRQVRPFTLLANDGTIYTVKLPQGPRNFRITVVKPYHQEAEDHVLVRLTPDEENSPAKETRDAIVVAAEQPPRRKRGRPRKNLVTTFIVEIATTKSIVASAFTAKEDADYALAVELRKKGVIITPSKLFELSDKAEIEGLAARGVFFIVGYNKKEHGGIRIFKSRLVREVKGKNEKPYEKSRLTAILT